LCLFAYSEEVACGIPEIFFLTVNYLALQSTFSLPFCKLLRGNLRIALLNEGYNA
jgi:hypothetical protein